MIDDVTPAFPHRPTEAASERGMSLRDYFAGQALIGMMACVLREQEFGKEFPEVNNRAAKLCYSLADAMLAERKGGGQ